MGLLGELSYVYQSVTVLFYFNCFFSVSLKSDSDKNWCE